MKSLGRFLVAIPMIPFVLIGVVCYIVVTAFQAGWEGVERDLTKLFSD